MLLVAFVLLQASRAQIPGTITAPAPAPATQPAAPGQAAPVAAPEEVQQLPPEVTFDTANERITLKDMGIHGAVDMHGPHSYYSVGFVLPHDRLPTHAALELSYHFAASVRPRTGRIRVTVNGQAVGVLTAPEQPQADREFAFVSLRVPGGTADPQQRRYV